MNELVFALIGIIVATLGYYLSVKLEKAHVFGGISRVELFKPLSDALAFYSVVLTVLSFILLLKGCYTWAIYLS